MKGGKIDMTKKIMISASTHACPFEKLPEYADRLQKAGVDYLHCDLMDGNFVQDVALSSERIKKIWEFTDLPLDVHLMATAPQDYFDACLEANAEFITIHYESFNDITLIKKAINDLKINGIKAGITLNPNTKVENLNDLLEYVDLVLVMSVVPGKSGQTFMLESIEKIKYLDTMRKQNNYNYIIEVDGGINDKTAHYAINAGADMLVSGSYLYKADDLKEAISKLKK